MRRRAGFDLRAVWTETLRGFRGRAAAVEVRVRPRPGASGRFGRMAADRLRDAAADAAVTLVFPSLGAAAAFLAGYVTEVEVLGPSALRTRLGEAGERLAAAYARRAAPATGRGG